MEQKGKIVSKEGTNLKVEIIRNSACAGDCDSCKGCSHEKRNVYVDIKDDRNYKEGEIVNLEAKSKWVLVLSAITYIVPVLFMILGYAIGGVKGEDLGILSAFIGLFMSVPVLFGINKTVKKDFGKNVRIKP